MAVFCTQCGTGLSDSTRFCPNCGVAVQSTASCVGRPLVRPLVRPLHGRRVAGVCLGLAQSYNWDVAVVRILAVVGLFFTAGIVLVAYLAAWLAVPSELPLPTENIKVV